MTASTVTELLSSLEDWRPWLQVEVGAPDTGEWATPAGLIESDGALLGELIDSALEADPRRSPQLVARGVFAEIVMCLLAPQVLTLSRQRRLPILDEGAVMLRIGSSEPAEVAWITDRIWALEGDQLAGSPDVTAVDSVDRLYELLVAWAVATLEPILESIKSRVRVGRVGMWGLVVDYFIQIGPQFEEPRQGDSVVELARFEAAAAGTRLGQRIPVLAIPHPDGVRLQTGRASCCLYYQEPADPGEEIPAWLEGPWERYCTTCPLIPAEETVRRLVRRIDQHEKESV